MGSVCKRRVQDESRLEKCHLLERELSISDAEPRLCLRRPRKNPLSQRETVLGDARRSIRGEVDKHD